MEKPNLKKTLADLRALRDLDPVKACSNLKFLLDSFPECVTLLVEAAVCHRLAGAHGDPAFAEICLVEALKVKPDSVEALSEITLLLEHRDPKRARYYAKVFLTHAVVRLAAARQVLAGAYDMGILRLWSSELSEYRAKLG